jgi:hypothetical protein
VRECSHRAALPDEAFRSLTVAVLWHCARLDAQRRSSTWLCARNDERRCSTPARCARGSSGALRPPRGAEILDARGARLTAGPVVHSRGSLAGCSPRWVEGRDVVRECSHRAALPDGAFRSFTVAVLWRGARIDARRRSSTWRCARNDERRCSTPARCARGSGALRTPRGAERIDARGARLTAGPVVHSRGSLAGCLLRCVAGIEVVRECSHRAALPDEAFRSLTVAVLWRGARLDAQRRSSTWLCARNDERRCSTPARCARGSGALRTPRGAETLDARGARLTAGPVVHSRGSLAGCSCSISARAWRRCP